MMVFCVTKVKLISLRVTAGPYITAQTPLPHIGRQSGFDYNKEESEKSYSEKVEAVQANGSISDLSPLVCKPFLENYCFTLTL